MTYTMTGRQLNVLVRALDELQDNNGKLSYDSFTEISCLVRELQTAQRESSKCKRKKKYFQKILQNYLTDGKYCDNISSSIRDTYSSIVRRIYYENV